MTVTSKSARVLEAFQAGEQLTAKQITSRYSVANPTALVSALRSSGFAIYGNKVTNAKGEVKTKYRLGQPTRRMVAAGIRAVGFSA